MTADEAAELIVRDINAFFDSVKIKQRNMLRSFWRETPAYGPPELAQALGTDAVKVFTLSAMLQQFINSIEPNSSATPPPGWTFSMNPDGSVSIEKAPEEIAEEPEVPAE